ncbi:MAG: amidohydrolase family protein [Spirochaetaceae bacterium]|jgi:dihydroorotase|nr:amidohydrolase family protein [Spirochaetaceae bacterium]
MKSYRSAIFSNEFSAGFPAAGKLFKNIRIVDEKTDLTGAVFVERGIISAVIPQGCPLPRGAALVVDGAALGGAPVLMPAFIDLHAHFRDPGWPAKETLESACLAAFRGGYGTVVCMANTMPVTDTFAAARALRKRAAALGLIDLYPALSLTRGMEGTSLSDITAPLPPPGENPTLLLSEDGKDVESDVVFLAALAEARRLGLPVSCHCEAPGAEDSVSAENRGVRRVIDLMRRVEGVRCHIAHVSTGAAAAMLREAKARGLALTGEAAPHHIALTAADAERLGAASRGRVNPPLRSEEDRRALIEAVRDGTIDAVATDHAPHTDADKEAGAPGFIGLETSFSVCFTELVLKAGLPLSRLSALMSAAPARILGLVDRGLIAPGLRADLTIVDLEAPAYTGPFASRGNNTPFHPPQPPAVS